LICVNDFGLMSESCGAQKLNEGDVLDGWLAIDAG
jgi:hypothetical protein